jgi:hypothetical protein
MSRAAGMSFGPVREGLERLAVLIANDFMSRMGGRYDDAHTH